MYRHSSLVAAVTLCAIGIAFPIRLESAESALPLPRDPAFVRDPATPWELILLREAPELEMQRRAIRAQTNAIADRVSLEAGSVDADERGRLESGFTNARRTFEYEQQRLYSGKRITASTVTWFATPCIASDEVSESRQKQFTRQLESFGRHLTAAASPVLDSAQMRAFERLLKEWIQVERDRLERLESLPVR